jgi:ankyrin repeat protein
MRKRLTVSGILAVLALATAAGAATPLLDAVKHGDQQAVRALLQQHPDVNAAAADGSTALHWAVESNDVAIVDQLIKAGAKVNIANRFGISPIMLAASNGNAPVAEALLKAGADANAATADGETVLMTAARTGNAEIVKALLARGANVNAKEGWQEQTALMWAAAEDHPDAVKVLIENGADANVKSKALEGAPPRQRLPPDQGQQGVHVTFPKGALTAVHYAARQNALGAIRALGEMHVDLDQKDPDGFTPAILAILSGNYDAAALLVEMGAGVDTVDLSGRTPLFTAVDMNTFEYSFGRPTAKPSGKMSPTDLVQFLLAHHANPNARLTDRVRPAKYDTAGNPNLTPGSTPLMKAASTADVPLMRILLDGGADPFIRNAEHSTTLMVAAGINWRRTAVGLSSAYNEANVVEAVKLLLDRGVEIDAFNDFGQTALHGAVALGNGRGGANVEDQAPIPAMKLIQLLVERGARFDTKDKAGKTAIDDANANNNLDAVAYFQGRSATTSRNGQ